MTAGTQVPESARVESTPANYWELLETIKTQLQAHPENLGALVRGLSLPAPFFRASSDGVMPKSFDRWLKDYRRARTPWLLRILKAILKGLVPERGDWGR